MRWIVLLALSGAALSGADTEFFETKIRPVLANKCYGCHSAQVKQPMGGVRLDSRESIQPLVDGAAESTRLYRSISYQHTVKMPPSGKLDAAVIEDFKKWIASGAEFPAVAAGKTVAKFWAFEPLKPGAVHLDLPQGARKLDRATLLRRVTFDLTGLPPTVDELDTFLKDGDYVKAVERLLASPQYGERWARHWMDLVRYSETNGHEYDNDKLNPWRYRDYLIRALNSDLGYDRIVREHIAGDLMKSPRLASDGATLESPLATGFYFFGEVLNSTTDPVKSRADDVDNQIDVIGKAFGGLTIACARCHDHKFDPIPTAEYYGIAGMLHSTEYREVSLDSPARRKAIDALLQGGALVPARSTVQYREGDTVFANFNGATFENWRSEGAAFGSGPVDGSASSLNAGAPEFVGTLTSPMIDMTDQKYLHIRLSGTKGDARPTENSPLRVTLVCLGYKARNVAAEGPDPKWVTLTLVLERNRRCYVELVDHSREGFLTVDEILFSDNDKAPDTAGGAMRQGPLFSVNVPPSSFGVVAADASGHDVRVHVRGNHQQLGDVAPRKYLSVLTGPGQRPVMQGSGCAELADRIVSNPLAARVAVNRVWQHHFGEGLVKTVDNFGLMGERPKDQALLDGLTQEFVASGWSLKTLHRRLVLSDLYQSTALAPRRLEAEAVRDAILAVSGRLDPQLYGPSIVPHISPYQNGRGRPASGPLDGDGRRSIYIQIRRNFIPPLFLAFDYPAPASTTGARGSSAVPSQALILLNNEFVHQQARVFAGKMLKLPAGERIDAMYLRAFTRPPEPAERRRVETFLQQQAGRGELDAYSDLAHVLINSPEFIYVR